MSIHAREKDINYADYLYVSETGSVLRRLVIYCLLCFRDDKVIGLQADRLEITEVQSVSVAQSLFARWSMGVQRDTQTDGC